MPSMTNMNELGPLVDVLTPAELEVHEELAPVYRAAVAIAVSSYNGRISTSPVEDLQAEHEPLVKQLLRRYDDGRGFIEFPIMRSGSVEEIVVSASGIAQYRLKQRRDPNADKDTQYFTSFPSS